MMRLRIRRSTLVVSAMLAIAASAAADGLEAGGDTRPGAPSRDAQIDALLRQNAEMQQELRALQQEVERARDEARAAHDEARAARSGRPSGLPPVSGDGAILSTRMGGVDLQLLDVSLDTLMAAGSSSADDHELETLQGGEHDPRQRGFTLQQVELSMLGAVDPYLTGEAHLIYFLDTEGESRFEVEEAFATSMMLPFGLEEHGLQLEAGQFFTEFGRLNPMHPHAWDWQDQPVILSRLLGGDGMRAPGVRAGWLTPLPWFSELHLGMQNASGETMVSFLANDEVFEERPIGGRPFDAPQVNGFEDFVYLMRWVNGFDLSDSVSTQLGASAVVGPNATGSDGRTWIVGGDWVVKWRSLGGDRGWPYLEWQSEFLWRDYRADSFFGCPDSDPVPEGETCSPVALGSETLEDWGFYTQLLWGFRRGWEIGLRYEMAGASGDDVVFDEDVGSFVSVSANDDPYRSTRHRLSPLLVFHPSEFSRVRLQYNYDHAKDLSRPSQHSVWAGLEFLFGAHAAHGY